MWAKEEESGTKAERQSLIMQPLLGTLVSLEIKSHMLTRTHTSTRRSASCVATNDVLHMLEHKRTVAAISVLSCSFRTCSFPVLFV